MYSDADLAEAFKLVLKEKGIERSDDFIIAFCKLVKEKVQFVHEFWEQGKYVFEEPTTYDEKVMTKKWNEKSKDVFTEVLNHFKSVTNWNSEEITKVFHEAEAKVGKIDMQLLRVLVIGVAGGPQLFDMLALIGKEGTVK